MSTGSVLNCLGALALELSADAGPGRATLEKAEAQQLAGSLAADLERLLPGVSALDGVFAAALFDPAELLRPGWPVHGALMSLAERVPGAAGGRVIAFGAHEGQMPARELQPDPAFAGGLLRLLPFALIGPEPVAQEIGRQMEERLLDTGMAGAHTALEAQSQFGVALQHARFLSLHDLCAMTALQYEHAGMAPLWRLIEAALLSPEREEWLREPGEPCALLVRGQVRMAAPDFAAYQKHIAAPGAEDAAAFSAYRRRQRQYAVVLGAHGIAVELVPLGLRDTPEAVLQA